MEIKNTVNKEEIAQLVANRIIELLNNNQKVFWFVTGGSSIEIISKASIKINQQPHKNLTIALTDERYGQVNHENSNWYSLIKNNFNLKEANIIQVLKDKNRQETAKDFNEELKKYLTDDTYKIGFFGVGKDGHTAGILPNSVAVNSSELACDYSTEVFERITITPKTIELLDEAIVYMQGEEKWPVVKDLLEKNISIEEQPAQILKKLTKLTIFTDYQNK